MADAREAPAGAEEQQTRSKQEAVVFTSVEAALAAVEKGEPCLHLNLTKPSHKYPGARLMPSQPMTAEELAELVAALPRLTQLKTLLLACKKRLQLAAASSTTARKWTSSHRA